MLKINTIVKSKNLKGAVKASGRIVKIYNGEEYAAIISNVYNTNITPWDTDFPEWKTKPVYVVMFDMPFKSCTPEQWVSHAVQKGIKAEKAINTYGTECPCTQIMCFPADDLEEIVPENSSNNLNFDMPTSSIPCFDVAIMRNLKNLGIKNNMKIIPTLIKPKT